MISTGRLRGKTTERVQCIITGPCLRMRHINCADSEDLPIAKLARLQNIPYYNECKSTHNVRTVDSGQHHEQDCSFESHK